MLGFLLRMVSCEAAKRHKSISHSGSVWDGAFVDVVDIASEISACGVIVVVA